MTSALYCSSMSGVGGAGRRSSCPSSPCPLSSWSFSTRRCPLVLLSCCPRPGVLVLVRVVLVLIRVAGRLVGSGGAAMRANDAPGRVPQLRRRHHPAQLFGTERAQGLP